MSNDEINKNLIIIDSIARSGTTLLNAIINTQNDFFTLKGHYTGSEYLYYSKNLNKFWDQNDSTPNQNSNQLIKCELKKHLKNRRDLLHSNTTEKYWINKLEKLDDSDSFKKFYDELRKDFNCKYLGLRYNNVIWYYDEFKKIHNGIWLTIIRNPYDRARSNMITHNWSENQCLELTKKYGTKIDKIINDKNFYLIYYEDLCNDPKNTLKDFFNLFQIDEKDLQLENLKEMGKDYKNQGSNLKLEGKNHTSGEKYNGIHKKSINLSKNFNFSNKFNNEMKKIINDFEVYKRYR